MVGFSDPVGNTNLHVGKNWSIVAGVCDEGPMKLVERRGAANSGPLVEVP